MYSVKEDISLGKYVINAQIKTFKKKKIAINPPQFEKTRKRIEKIVSKLAKVSDIPNLPYQVYIFDKPDVANAFCLPGGIIGIYSGIFDPQKGLIDQHNDSEIASVLGHEIAHATMRHVTRRLTSLRGWSVLGSVVSLSIGQSAGQNWQYIFDQAFYTGTSLYMPSYSRKFEREADKVGFYYLAKAGFDPQAAIRIWERAAKKKKEKGKKDKTQFFSSHPASGERANALRAFLNEAYAIQKQSQKRQKIIEDMKREY